MEKKNEVATTVDTSKIETYLKTMGLAKDLTKEETQQFIEIATAFQLNPFKREIYASKYGSNFSIITGYEVYIKRAERSGQLAGWNVSTEGTVQGNNLKATITIYRKDFTHPFVHEVYYSEYVQRTKEGNPNKFWREKPITMTKKVAIAQGFRMCFSDEMGGMPYTMDEIGTEDVPHTVVEDAEHDLNALGQEILNCKSEEELKVVYDKYPGLHKDKGFLNTLKARKEEILSFKKKEAAK